MIIATTAHARRLLLFTAAITLGGCINPNRIGVQTAGTVTGRILDVAGDVPIAAATVRDELDRQATADPDGAFAITLPSGTHTLAISAVGYTGVSIEVDVPKQKTALISKDGYIRLRAVKNF